MAAVRSLKSPQDLYLSVVRDLQDLVRLFRLDTKPICVVMLRRFEQEANEVTDWLRNQGVAYDVSEETWNKLLTYAEGHYNFLANVLGHLGTLSDFLDEQDEERRTRRSTVVPSDQPDNVLRTRIVDLPFTTSTQRRLSMHGIHLVGDLSRLTLSDLEHLEGIGRKTIQEVLDKIPEILVSMEGA